MLINMKKMLEIADTYDFTVGAFNVTEVSNFKCVFETAEKMKSPTIIACAANELDFCEKEYYNYVKEKLMNSPIPFCLHLDHGRSLKDCIYAIQAGFTSVMFDGSHLSYEENIRLTKQVVDIAHLIDVSVEGEIGTIGNTGNSDEGGSDIIYTQPDEVVDYVNKTGVDCLAIAIGTSHGLYPDGYKPQLQLDLLKKIHNVSSVPLVLHGGSGQDDEQIIEATQYGIRKINVASEYKAAYTYELNRIINETQDFKFSIIMPKAMSCAKEIIQHKMEVFKSVDKAYLYYDKLKSERDML